MAYSGNSIEDLKNQINIVDVIGRVVPLKRAGANYKGVCPFHNEKTPSFVVSEQKQIFTCFGCGATGNVIEFEKRYYNLEFKEACEKLAKENGLEISFSSPREKQLEKYYEVNKEAAKFFYRAFTEKANAGYTYMKNRGIEDSILKKFGIGFADGEWDSLYKYFKEKGIDEEILLELGLISKGQKGKYYDKFRNRVIFPIISTSGKVIGFGGRIIDKGEPKYLNSPENRIFQKKNNLYGLSITKQDIGKAGDTVVVEGYMDVISLYQGGVRNVTASLGTALTENQARLLKRYTKNAVLAYDSDEAGRKAALRGIDILGNEGLKVRVLHVTDGKDPDEFIKKRGKDAFLKLIEKAPAMIEYKLEAAKAGWDLSTDEGRIDYMKKASEILKSLSPVEADIYMKRLSEDLKISEGAIRREVEGLSDKRERTFNRQSVGEELAEKKLSVLEATMIKLALVNPSLTEKLLENYAMFSGDFSRKVVNLIFEIYGLKGSFEPYQVYERLDPDESEILRKAADKILITGNEETVLSECVKKWKIQQARQKRESIMVKLSLAEESGTGDSVKKMMEELMEIDKEIKNYVGGK